SLCASDLSRQTGLLTSSQIAAFPPVRGVCGNAQLRKTFDSRPTRGCPDREEGTDAPAPPSARRLVPASRDPKRPHARRLVRAVRAPPGSRAPGCALAAREHPRPPAPGSTLPAAARVPAARLRRAVLGGRHGLRHLGPCA